MNVTIITGWIAAVLLFFNFATCLAMPWVNKKFNDDKGEGCKNKEQCEAITLNRYHKPIVYLSIIAIILHITVAVSGLVI